jgi:EAL domain-containing protein (putative c-di-GMP-specific phosphodiesterase class I)
MDVIAEGVEDEETADRLCALGAEHLQGYFISKPLAAADLLEWLPEPSSVASASSRD